jgi:hypothetical protein
MSDDEIKRPEEAAPEAQPQPDSHVLQDGIDQQGHQVHRAVTTLDEVAEEHVYVRFRCAEFESMLEFDLVGDQAVFESAGKLPPVIHLICPRCARNGHPDHALSITHSAAGGTKTFEIEELPADQHGVVMDQNDEPLMASDGGYAIRKRLLTIREPFKCEYCHRRYKVTDNEMRDA